MFNAVIHLRAFGVVETVESTHEVAGDTPYTFKAYTLADFILWHGKLCKR